MNVLELLDTHRIDYATQHKDVRSGWVGTSCPWCARSPAERYLGVNTHNGAVVCWRCGRHSLADLLAAVAGLPLPAAIAAAKGVARLPQAPRPQGRLTVPGGVGPLQPPHKRYLRRRGFDPAVCAALWGMQGIGLAGRLPWTLYLPIYDRDGNEVSWTTRTIGEGLSRRYQGARPEEEATPAKSLIYGGHLARHTIVVHEGPLDAVATGPGAGAVMGLAVTDAQVVALAEYARVVVCFDAEPEAQRRAAALCERLAPFGGEVIREELEAGVDGKDIAVAESAGARAALRAKYLEDSWAGCAPVP